MQVSRPYKAIAGFLIWLMAFSPGIILAQDLPRLPPAQVESSQQIYWDTYTDPNASNREKGQAAGSLGSQVGKSVGESTVQPSMSPDGQLNLGTVTDENGFVMPNQADVGAFFPGTSGQQENPAAYAFPGQQQPSINDLESADDASLLRDSPAFKSALFQDAQRDQPNTVMGGAYKILLNDANRGQPDFRNDPVFSRTRDVYDQANQLTDEFSDCSIARQVQETESSVRIHDYKTCRRMEDKSESCTIQHVYGADVIEVASGENFNITPCESGNCYLAWIGKVGHNYWSGNCAEFNQRTTFRVINPDAIVKATITYIIFDDVMQLYLGPDGNEEKIWQGPVQYWPPDVGRSCELSTNGEARPNIDVTRHFKDVEPGELVHFRQRVVVGGKGDGYARIKIDYDPTKIVQKDEWIPSSPTCLESALATEDEFVGGGYECTDQPPLDGNGCATSGSGAKICPEYFDTPPVNVNPTCREVSVEADYSFYTGESCFLDREGNEVCIDTPPVEGGGEITDCREYEENPQCSFVSTECVDGMEGASTGECYIQMEEWDCGEFVQVDDYNVQENIQCDGEFLCQGDSCGDVRATTSNSFNKAAALLQAANFMAMDGQCEEVDINQNRVCEVFGGDDYECKIIGLPDYGIDAVDCCDQPVEITPGQYIGLMSRTGVMDSAFMNINPDLPLGSVRGAYQSLRDPATSTFTEVTKPFTNAAETVTGPVKDAIAENLVKPVEAFLDDLKQKLADELTQFFAEEGVKGAGQAAGAGGGQAAADAAGSQAAGVVGTVGNVMSVVMGAYTAVMVAYLALQIIFECTEDEIQLAVKRELKACSRVGSYCARKICVVPTGFGCAVEACVDVRNSYCCYNSPLSRIVMEQAGPQLGRTGRNGMGSPKNPQCDGLPLGQLENLDWSQIDLSEWTALLQEEGALKTGPGNLNIEALTGSGHALSLGQDPWGERDNVLERTQDRLGTGSVDDTRMHHNQNFYFNPD